MLKLVIFLEAGIPTTADIFSRNVLTLYLPKPLKIIRNKSMQMYYATVDKWFFHCTKGKSLFIEVQLEIISNWDERILKSVYCF